MFYTNRIARVNRILHSAGVPIVHDYSQIQVQYVDVARQKLGIVDVDVTAIEARADLLERSIAVEHAARISADSAEAAVRSSADNNLSALIDQRGLPAGGSPGQSLTKVSGADYDAQWSTVSGGVGGDDTLTWMNL